MIKVPQNSVRKKQGMSLIELLVSVAVISIAIAGISDLIWLNTSWAQKFMNKSSASFSAQTFLKRLRDDLGNTYAVSEVSDGTNLILFLSSEANKANKNPFPPPVSLSDQVTYKLVGSNISRTTTSGSWTVLTGVVGPKKIGSNSITILQYVPKVFNSSDTPTLGIRENAALPVRSVITDLEILNRSYGKSTASESTTPIASELALRAEFFARNDLE